MKDFDAVFEERDSLERRTFRIRGEEFIRKASVRPEALFEAPEQAVTSEAEGLAWADEQMLAMIEDVDGAHDRYRALRARADNPLGLNDMRELKTWLIGEFAGLPTNAPSPSGNGRATSGTRSTARSSSTAAAG